MAISSCLTALPSSRCVRQGVQVLLDRDDQRRRNLLLSTPLVLIQRTEVCLPRAGYGRLQRYWRRRDSCLSVFFRQFVPPRLPRGGCALSTTRVTDRSLN